MFSTWGSSGDGTGTQEGVPLKTAGGTRGRNKMGGHNRAWRSEGARVQLVTTHGELLAGGHRGASAAAPGTPTLSEAEVTLVGGCPAEWAGNLGCLEGRHFGSQANLSGFSNWDNLAV